MIAIMPDDLECNPAEKKKIDDTQDRPGFLDQGFRYIQEEVNPNRLMGRKRIPITEHYEHGQGYLYQKPEVLNQQEQSAEPYHQPD